MTHSAEHAEVGGAADQLMRRVLNEVDGLRARMTREADEVRRLRNDVRTVLLETEQQARAHVGQFAPRDLGEQLRLDLTHAFAQRVPARRTPQAPPVELAGARREWDQLARSAESDSRVLITAKREWDARTFKRQSSMPAIPAELWASTERLSEIHAVLPALREQYVVEKLDAKAHLNAELAEEIERRMGAIEAACAESREVLAGAVREASRGGADWDDPRWTQAAPMGTLEHVLRAGALRPGLPASAGIPAVPLWVAYPLSAGVAVAAGVARRQEAIAFLRSLVLRALAATPGGQLHVTFIDPVALGQSVADFRHVAEFDPRLVDTKTWISEREIEAKMNELAAHLELVISTYLRGQFDSIDQYNRHAGEVAEPYRMLVVFDYPTGFSSAAARQLLSLIENGTRCGVHVVLHHDPAAGSVDDVPVVRLVHSMQRFDLTTANGRVTLPAPIGQIDADFVPDAAPPIAFSADGRPETPAAQLLFNVGAASRTERSGPVTLERVVPILNKLTATRLSAHVPAVRAGAPELDPADASTWWTAHSREGACAPIGRSGAQDVASLYFSSTEIAGGAIVVGLPRSGKSTALHAAIVSLAMIYPPDELELYLVDSKHGVEFKVYDRLPHARLVSINSEREFSVSVLQSLDGEIKRRAELMKGETAGRANITEYRSATGNPMPRIVLVMDEFHELFEEDDTLGQAAFRAFSNIVRQGPFAGIHVVVASQTLSSMPAMDRSTLSLLPMRVAFMCNDYDADLVMGDVNRDVKALSRQGEGILNPVRGEPSHNKPFRGMYIAADERSHLLAELSGKAADSGWARRPRVFDGDTLADRPLELREPSARRPVFALGEPFDLDPFAGVTLRRGRGANVLLFGSAGDDETSDVAAAGAAQSFVADAVNNDMDVRVIDFVGDVEPSDGLDLLELCEALSVPYRRTSGLAGTLDELLGEVVARREADDYRRRGILLVLNGLQRALDLAPEDRYPDPDEPPQLGGSLARIVRDGPEVGCHTVALVEGVSQFERRLGRELFTEFEWCAIASDAGTDDVATITGVFNTPEIRPRQLLVADRGTGKQRRVRAYPRHTQGSLPTNQRSTRS
jgi:S-DNA-T family DNA segregation ATPase FtsK/SpoIIIE